MTERLKSLFIHSFIHNGFHEMVLRRGLDFSCFFFNIDKICFLEASTGICAGEWLNWQSIPLVIPWSRVRVSPRVTFRFLLLARKSHAHAWCTCQWTQLLRAAVRTPVDGLCAMWVKRQKKSTGICLSSSLYGISSRKRLLFRQQTTNKTMCDPKCS